MFLKKCVNFLVFRTKTTLNSSKKIIFNKMNGWENEKQKFLSLSFEEKRIFYTVSEHISLEDIPTWKKYVENSEDLAQTIPTLTNHEINPALNSVLVEKVSLFKGDITCLEADAIVNAANKKLLGGGGVDRAIHNAAGRSLLEECKTLNGCETGGAKITGGYKLPAKYVIHTVGPVGEKSELLKQCYKSCLNIMESKKLKTIAFPCISTGIYGYPNEPAAHIAAYEVRKHLEKHSDDIDRIIFCVFLDKDETIYEGILQSYFPN